MYLLMRTLKGTGLLLDNLLNKQLSCYWFEMPWCTCDVTVMSCLIVEFQSVPLHNVKCLSLESFTVSLHSPNGRHLPAIRAVQGDCQWSLKNSGNTHRSHESTIRQSQLIFRPANHKRVMPAIWEAMSHIPLTVIMPPGWDCETVREVYPMILVLLIWCIAKSKCLLWFVVFWYWPVFTHIM